MNWLLVRGNLDPGVKYECFPEGEHTKLEAELHSANDGVAHGNEVIEDLLDKNTDLRRRLLSHKKGEGVKATCDVHGDWWYVDDEPIICPSCNPDVALSGEAKPEVKDNQCP